MHHNYRRNFIERNRAKWNSLPKGEAKTFQRFSWKKRRALVRKLLNNGTYSDIPTNYKRHVRWDYW